MNNTTRLNLARVAAVLSFAMLLPCWGVGNCVWADEVTDGQALQEAQAFVNNRLNTSGGPRRAPGATPQLTAAGQVSGLYLFNIGDGEGFVVVSNDDSTTPILGFAESGAIDPDNMPTNMRAWLQGYADEIAWLRQEGGQGADSSVLTFAPRRVGTHSTDAIAPLVSTTWNQLTPYNNLTPYYKETNSGILFRTNYAYGYSHCATGCVATAMAQVMKYHQWPASPTEAIPAYQWTSSITLPELTASITFDWSNMLNSYSGSYTDTQANAVATLMKYCGWSVTMDYGPESGSNTENVAAALKEYYDYNDETTTYVSRSLYTYANWVDLMYYELTNGRPVVYGGQSSGGGHEFVCDGYKYESQTDFFHINWGWGGLSDNYFVLSALDPEQQGTGGSSSTDGFHYGQDAVIGIQPSTGTGKLSETILPSDIKLSYNSITLSSTEIVIGSSVDIIANITNNSTDDYDGDIVVGRKAEGYGTLVNNNFLIPAGTTRDCVFTYTPTETGTYELVSFMLYSDGQFYTDGNVKATLYVVPQGTPTGLAASDIRSGTVVLDWAENGTAASWVVAYKAVDATAFTTVSTSAHPYTLSGLNPDTEYTVKVRPATASELWSVPVVFTTDILCAAPKDLAVNSITHDAAIANWEGYANSYNVRWGVLPEDAITTASTWLQYDNGQYAGGFGTDSEDDEWTWGVMYPGSMVTGNLLTKVAIYEASNNSEDITVEIYSGGDDAPVTKLYTEVVTPLRNGFHEVTLAQPVKIGVGQNLWIALTEKGKYPMAVCKSSEANSRWILNGGWYNTGLNDFGFMIRGYIESEGIDPDAVTWAYTYNAEKPCPLTGLTPATNYVVQVQGNYAEGSSEWTTQTFTTLPNVILTDNAADNGATLAPYADGAEVSVTLGGRTLYKDSEWNTICLPFDLVLDGSPLEGATAKTLTDASMTNTTVTLTFGDAVDELEAGVPYIIKWTDGNDIAEPVFTNVHITDTEGKTIEKADGHVKFIGYYDAFGITAADDDIYYMTAGNKLKHTAKDRTLNACRAYFQFSANSVGQARQFVLDFGEGGTTTAIGYEQNVENADSVRAIYDLQGRRVSLRDAQPGKGLYIRDGRKVVVK